VLFSDVEESIMMMDIEKGSYYSLDGPAARIWALLETPRTLPEICAVLVDEFEVEPDACASDTAEFVEELHRLELVAIA
jgi:hypothetical protein